MPGFLYVKQVEDLEYFITKMVAVQVCFWSSPGRNGVPYATHQQTAKTIETMNARPLTLKRVIKLALISAFVSGISSCVPGKVIDVVPGSEDCHTGCPAAAAGWPLAYITDGHGLSPHGSADFMGMLLGLDRLDVLQAVLNWLLWLSIVIPINRLMRQVASAAGRRRR